MIDHLFGRPNPSWKRVQVFLVLIFWSWRIAYGNANAPRLLWLRYINRVLRRFTPWQIIVSTLTAVYAMRNVDKILGLGAPEPLADLYSPSYYRATWISTGLDAGFATAMTIRPKWLKDICSMIFSVYYTIYASEADEKLRRFRAAPTVEMFRTTWGKTMNPYLRALTRLPRVAVRRKLIISRPADSSYSRPITAWLFFAPPEQELCNATDLILDLPGGGFVCMTPEHHEERLHMWAVHTGKPVLSIDYGKAPEYTYPFAIDECFDAYWVLVESSGSIIGMSGDKFNVILTGDSAGAHNAVCVMLKLLESEKVLPHPIALVLNYAALDFNFTSWMTPANLRVLESERSSDVVLVADPELEDLSHTNPLSMVGDRKALPRLRSWRDTIRHIPLSSDKHVLSSFRSKSASTIQTLGHGFTQIGRQPSQKDSTITTIEQQPNYNNPMYTEMSRRDDTVVSGDIPILVAAEKPPTGTRLTMTSRTGYFQDRIVSPSMMRAMAILYIGPHSNPDFASDYHLSPILAPAHLLAQFPPLLMSCGEKDPFVDDTLIFAGRVREAKRERIQDLNAAIKALDTDNGLMTSSNSDGVNAEKLAELIHERVLLMAQNEDDWVQTQIFSDWSHGYLQMPSLMSEARTVIYGLADWMDDVFANHNCINFNVDSVNQSVAINGTSCWDTEANRYTIPSASTDLCTPNRLCASATAGDRLDQASSMDASRESHVLGKPEYEFNGPSSEQYTGAVLPAHGRHKSDPYQPACRTSSPARAPTGKAGQTITETELVRRRRLLDSHLIAVPSTYL